MVNLVIVSHSARLGEGVGELARQMLINDGCKLAIAAGIDDPENPIGTDPVKVMNAIESVADSDHVLVMMDIGSALLSAETALELLEPEIAAKVRLCAAPLVEGTLAATVSAASGADINKVLDDAMNALEAKRVQLGLPSQPHKEAKADTVIADRDAKSVSVVIKNDNGLHVRPASRLVAALAGFDASLMLEKDGKCVRPDSINQIALLQVRRNDQIRLLATGPDASAALAAFKSLAAENFGEHRAITPLSAPAGRNGGVEGNAVRYPQPRILPVLQKDAGIVSEQQRLKLAIEQTLTALNTLTEMAEEKYSADIAAIFSGHYALLDDTDLYEAACEIIRSQHCDAQWAWHLVLTDLSQQYRQLDDEYLQARYIDIEDILYRTQLNMQSSHESLPEFAASTIIVADDIFPSTVLQLNTQQVRGICLREGSGKSHGAIIARHAGIAFLSQQGEALDTIPTGAHLILDITGQRATLA